MGILYPLENVIITGEWANSPDFYAQFGQVGHNGLDMAASVGTPVHACDAGVIVAEGWGVNDNWMGEVAGIYVRIKHWWGYSAYAHLSATIVDVGQAVSAGQRIAYSGATGFGTGPHLHFETFPLFPNFGNGFAGRINPRTLGLSPLTPGAKPTPPPSTQKDTIDMAKSFSFVNERKTKQVISANNRTCITFRDAHSQDKTDRTLVRGPGQVHTLIVNVTIEGGQPGKRVDLQLSRETGTDQNARRIGRSRDVFDTYGLFSKQIVFSGDLSKGHLIRAYVQTEAGTKDVTVTEFYGSGSAS